MDCLWLQVFNHEAATTADCVVPLAIVAKHSPNARFLFKKTAYSLEKFEAAPRSAIEIQF